MWERLGRRNTKRRGAAAPLSGAALGRMGELFGRQEPKKRVQTPYGGPVVLGLVALAVATTAALVVLVLRRRAVRQGSPIEESNEGANEEA